MDNQKSFSEINKERCESSIGFNQPMESIPQDYFMTCLTEEVGEFAGVLKRMTRGFIQRDKDKYIAKLKRANVDAEPINDDVLEAMWKAELNEKLGLEMADIFIYLDLFATKLGIHLKSNVMAKFNFVSEDMGCFDKFAIESTTQI